MRKKYIGYTLRSRSLANNKPALRVKELEPLASYPTFLISNYYDIIVRYEIATFKSHNRPSIQQSIYSLSTKKKKKPTRILAVVVRGLNIKLVNSISTHVWLYKYLSWILYIATDVTDKCASERKNERPAILDQVSTFSWSVKRNIRTQISSKRCHCRFPVCFYVIYIYAPYRFPREMCPVEPLHPRWLIEWNYVENNHIYSAKRPINKMYNANKQEYCGKKIHKTEMIRHIKCPYDINAPWKNDPIKYITLRLMKTIITSDILYFTFFFSSHAYVNECFFSMAS